MSADAPRCRQMPPDAPRLKPGATQTKPAYAGLDLGSRSQVQPGNEKQRLRLLLQNVTGANFQNVEYISESN